MNFGDKVQRTMLSMNLSANFQFRNGRSTNLVHSDSQSRVTKVESPPLSKELSLIVFNTLDSKVVRRCVIQMSRSASSNSMISV